MARIFALSHFKGGCGKSFISNALAVISSKNGNRTLLIDGDSQSNQRMMFGIEQEEVDVGTYEFLTEGISLEECVYPINKNLDLLPSTFELSDLDEEVYSNPANYPNKYNLFEMALQPYMDDYDVIIIDLPPSIGSLISKNTFSITNCELIIPTTPEKTSFEGILDVLRSVEQFKLSNKTLSINGIIINRIKKKSLTHRRVVSSIKQLGRVRGVRMIGSPIKDSVKVAEATEQDAQSIVQTMPNSEIAAHLEEIYMEVIEHETIYNHS
jgi:chromosome partitioning protein